MTTEILKQAQEAHANGDLDAAKAQYQSILETQPEQVEALFLLGVLYQQQHNHIEAQSVFSKLEQVRLRQSAFYNQLGAVVQGSQQLDAAVKLYEESIRLTPNLIDPYNNLANILSQVGKHPEATQLYQRALAINPNVAQVHFNLGNTLLNTQAFEQAVYAYENALKLDPQLVEARQQLADVYRRQGQYELAALQYIAFLQQRPNDDRVKVLLGVVRKDQGQLDEALRLYNEALKSSPNSFWAHFERGIVYQLKQDIPATIAAYTAVIELNPESFEAHYNLAMIYNDLKEPLKAIMLLQKAIAINANVPQAHLILGNLYKEQGSWNAAIERYNTAIAINPNDVAAYVNAATIFKFIGDYPKALELFQHAMQLAPQMVEIYTGLADLQLNRGYPQETIALLEKAYSIRPSSALRYKIATTLPCVYQSHEDMTYWRNRFIEQLAQLQNEDLQFRDPCIEVGATNFYLTYHGLNDRDVQKDIAALFAKQPIWTQAPQPQNKKPKIGFISRFIEPNHTIGHLFLNTAIQLDPDKFDVTIFTFGYQGELPLPDRMTHVNLTFSDMFYARDRITEAGLDVAFILDIGMDPLTYFLAFNRLAPVQCMTFGHPVTSGIPTMDYFISSKHFEVAEAQDHYTEKLLLLNDLPVYYKKPDFEELGVEPLTRAHYGLDESKNWYICPQSLFKFHPDFDDMIKDILTQDPDGILILVNAQRKEWQDLLMARWQKVMPEVANRIHFMKAMSRYEFLNLLALGDVMLDTPHFCGGNTSLEAFSFGTPIVTLPSEFLRARLTEGFYKKMKLTDLVAKSPEQYVKLAVKLGTDKKYHDGMQKKILSANSVLYENQSAVKELEDFFLKAIKTAAKGAKKEPATV